MKRYVFIMILAIYVLSSPISTFVDAKPESPLKPLDDLTSFIEKEELPLHSWEIVAKTSITFDETEAALAKIQELYPKITFQTEETNMAIKIVGSDPQTEQTVSEVFTVVVSRNSGQKVDLIYKASGNKYTNSNKEVLKKNLDNLQRALFQENTTIFTCVKSETGGNMEGVLTFNNFKSEMNITPVETVMEDDFFSFSGYTSHWKESIPTIHNRDMNVQFAGRSGLGGKTTLTIGTPIITTEY